MTMLPVPNLDEDQIVCVVTGLRPCRRGGLRIEIERLGSTTVVHNYGQGGCGVTIGFGCASLAADLVESIAHPPETVVVLGGGVVGLTAADELLRRGFGVRVVADKWLSQTTSNIAGAIWLPTGLDVPSTPEARERFDRVQAISRARLAEIDRARFGVETLPVYEPEYAEHHAEYYRPGVLEPPVACGLLPLAGAPRQGRVFSTDFIHTPRFLRELRADIVARGALLETARIASIKDVHELNARVVVNCLGLGSGEVFGDTAMFPAYGLLVHLKPQALGYIVHDGYKYMFPREDALLLGGCFRPDVWSLEPDADLAREIVTHHRRFFGIEES